MPAVRHTENPNLPSALSSNRDQRSTTRQDFTSMQKPVTVKVFGSYVKFPCCEKKLVKLDG